MTGVDASEAAIRRARERFGDEATFRRPDLTEPLDVAGAAFELVFGNLEEWRPVLEEFRRILVPDGTLVVTTIHPRYVRSSTDVECYCSTERVTNDWPSVESPTYYRPTSAVVTPFLDAGFRLETFDEPRPRGTDEEYAPERYREALREPELVVVRGRAGREVRT